MSSSLSLFFDVSVRVVIATTLTCLAACAYPEELLNDGSGVSGPKTTMDSGFQRNGETFVLEGFNSVSLFAGTNPESFPVIRMNSDERLTLVFDTPGLEGGLYRIHFIHMDNNWRPDLLPVQYMVRFQDDELLDYQVSRRNDVPYVHYSYTFPNEKIDFSVSGNYLLQVVAFEDDSQVFMEIPFFVTEQTAEMNLAIDQILYGGSAWPLLQPVLDVRPPDRIASEVFNFTTCFIQNGMVAYRRCPDRAYLATVPDLRFQLDPEDAFDIAGDFRMADISRLAIGGDIVFLDVSRVPYEVELEVDQALLEMGNEVAGTFGNSIYRVASGFDADPGTEGRYVRTHFRYSPRGNRELVNGVRITGSFLNWAKDIEMTWLGARGYYAADIVLKQGKHVYRYLTDEPGQDENRNRPIFATRNYLDAFFYYRDDFLGTDRLLGRRFVVSE